MTKAEANSGSLGLNTWSSSIVDAGGGRISSSLSVERAIANERSLGLELPDFMTAS